MARRECPNGHPTVVRNDPKSTGHIAQCDTCGWSASYVVVREESEWQQSDNHEAERAQLQEQQRRPALAAGETRRRGD